MATSEAVKLDLDAQTWIDAITQFGGDERSRHNGLIDNYYELNDRDNVFRLAEYGVTTWADKDALLQRAIGRLIYKDFNGALEDANRAVKIAPTSPHPYSIRSNIFEAMQDRESVARDRAKAQELDPDFYASCFDTEQDEAE